MCCSKCEGGVDYSTVISWFKNFCPRGKNHNDRLRLNKLKTMEFQVVFQTIETNLVSIIHKLYGEIGISLSSVVPHLLKHPESFALGFV